MEVTAHPSAGLLGETATDRASATSRITRGVRRALAALGQVSITELPLKNGRRADILAVDAAGSITLIEVKSSLSDFTSDRKWPEYEPYCDRFYFAVAVDFPLERLPDDCGVMVADAYGGEVIREAEERRLNAARRKAMLLRFCLAAGQRLHRQEDPVL